MIKIIRLQFKRRGFFGTPWHPLACLQNNKGLLQQPQARGAHHTQESTSAVTPLHHAVFNGFQGWTALNYLPSLHRLTSALASSKVSSADKHSQSPPPACRKSPDRKHPQKTTVTWLQENTSNMSCINLRILGRWWSASERCGGSDLWSHRTWASSLDDAWTVSSELLNFGELGPTIRTNLLGGGLPGQNVPPTVEWHQSRKWYASGWANVRMSEKGDWFKGVASMTVLAVLAVLESTSTTSCLSYKIQHNEPTVAVLTVLAVRRSWRFPSFTTAIPLKLNPPFPH